MKRILSLFLVCIIALSLAACANTEPTEPHQTPTTQNQNTEQPTTDSAPIDDPTTDTTQPSDSEADQFVWNTKTMDPPSIAQLDSVNATLKTTDNQILTSTLVNPSIQCDFSDDFKTQIKASPLLKDYVFATTIEESGAPVSYSNIDGLKYTYKYEETFSAKSEEDTDNIFTQFNDFSVTKQWETQSATNFNQLTMSITLHGDMINSNAQTEILNLLKIVFGKEIGEYLCYSEAKDKYGELCVVTQKDCNIVFRRTVDWQEDIERCDVHFSVYTINFGTTYDVISCDYTPVADFTNLNNLLGDDFKFNPSEYDRFGENTMTKHFKDYLGMETSSKGVKGYSYQYITAENGFAEETITIDGDILQKDVVRMFVPKFRVALTSKFQDDTLIYTKGDLQFSTGCSNETDQSKLHQMFDEHGFVIMESLLAGDQQVSTNMKMNANGYFDEYKSIINIMGKDVEVDFNYRIDTNMKGGYQGFINVGWYKDLR
jgi:hypothetical protein